MNSSSTNPEHLPTVSVVIPCFNYGRFVLEAIDSCLASTFEDLEVLVVDDGSTDQATIDILRSLDRPRTRVIWQSNKKLPAARNTGFREARGKYVLPLDADDLIHPTLIEKSVWVLENRPDVGFVSYWLDIFGTENLTWKPIPFNYHTLLFANHVTVTSLVRREAWERAGGYNESMTLGYEDWDFWIKLGSAGWLGHQISEPIFRYRKHGKSMITESVKRHDEIVRQIRRNHPEVYKKTSIDRLKLIWEDGINPDTPRPSAASSAKRLARKTLKHLVPEYLRPEVVHHLGRFRSGIRSAAKWPRARRPLDRSTDLSSPAPGRLQPVRPPACTLSFLGHPVLQRTSGKRHATMILPDLGSGGVSEVQLDLARTLVTQGYDLTVVTTEHAEPDLWSMYQTWTSDVFCLPNYGIDARLFPAAIARLIESRKSDLVFLMDSARGANMIPALRARFPLLPIVAWTHAIGEMDPTFDCVGGYAGELTRIVTGCPRSERALYPLVDQDRTPLHHIPPAVDSVRFSPLEGARRTDGRVVGFLGNLSEDKGIIRFLRIAAMLSESDPDDRLRFVVVGDGEQGAEARELARASGIEGRVTFTGRISEPERSVASMDLLIAPSKRTRTSKSALEAMAAGVPVLASRTAGWPDWFEDGKTVYLEDIFDEVGFVRRALQILAIPEGHDQVLQRARRIVLEDHSVRKFRDSVRDLLSDVLPSCPPHFD
jgi:glycosyltransferase involved in cell wall biosynthesis